MYIVYYICIIYLKTAQKKRNKLHSRFLLRCQCKDIFESIFYAPTK